MTDGRDQQFATPDVGSVLGGRFRIIRRIGEGGMGVVLEAENTTTGKRVAIKWMHPQLAAQADAAHRMVREARASARVRHPNVVDVYDVIEETGAIFLVMELLDGEPLTALIERGDTAPHVLISLIIDAMRGVSAAHRENVIHRDVKPDNIFLARESDRSVPTAKVLDFGISKLAERDALSLTRTGMTLGTPMYMSYEQLAGIRDIDARADVYAFGVILYEALTGQAPYSAETFSELIIKVTTTEPPTPKSLKPELPGALSTIVQKAMARDRNDRTPSLDALIAQLGPFATAQGFYERVTALAGSSGGLDATVAVAPATGSQVARVAQAREHSASVASGIPRPSRTASKMPGDGNTPFAQSFELAEARDSISIPRTFTWKSAVMWGGLVLAVIAGAAWLAGRSPPGGAPTATEPHLVETAPQPQAAAQPIAPAESNAVEPNAPSAPALPTPAAERASAEKKAPIAEPAAKEEPVVLRPIASHPSAARPIAGRRKHEKQLADPAAEPAPTPAKPGATLRAGRPRSQDF